MHPQADRKAAPPRPRLSAKLKKSYCCYTIIAYQYQHQYQYLASNSNLTDTTPTTIRLPLEACLVVPHSAVLQTVLRRRREVVVAHVGKDHAFAVLAATPCHLPVAGPSIEIEADSV
jgi:hypothetical protein